MTIILFNKKRNRDDFGDDFGGDAASSKEITVGSSIQGTIEQFGDQDWFKISLDAGETYEFTLNGVPGTGLDPVLHVADSSGVVVAYDDDSGGNGNSKITYDPTYTGTHYLVAGGFRDARTGAYSLSTQHIAPPAPTYADGIYLPLLTDLTPEYNTLFHAPSLPGSISFQNSGVLLQVGTYIRLSFNKAVSFEDVHWKIIFDAQAATGGKLINPFLTIQGSAGRSYVASSPTGSPKIQWYNAKSGGLLSWENTISATSWESFEFYHRSLVGSSTWHMRRNGYWRDGASTAKANLYGNFSYIEIGPKANSALYIRNLRVKVWTGNEPD